MNWQTNMIPDKLLWLKKIPNIFQPSLLSFANLSKTMKVLTPDCLLNLCLSSYLVDVLLLVLVELVKVVVVVVVVALVEVGRLLEGWARLASVLSGLLPSRLCSSILPTLRPKPISDSTQVFNEEFLPIWDGIKMTYLSSRVGIAQSNGHPGPQPRNLYKLFSLLATKKPKSLLVKQKKCLSYIFSLLYIRTFVINKVNN